MINSNIEKTFIDFATDDFIDYIERKKFEYKNEEYIEFIRRKREITEKYSNINKLFNDLEPVILNEEEIEKLIELIKITSHINVIEEILCFKLGMKEIISL